MGKEKQKGMEKETESMAGGMSGLMMVGCKVPVRYIASLCSSVFLLVSRLTNGGGMRSEA